MYDKVFKVIFIPTSIRNIVEPVNEPFLGRITGSASVDTLVRVGLEKQHGLTPESRMTVIDDFSAAVDDELSVSQGQLVYMLYTEQEWMYVISDDGKEGFIPRSFAKPLRSPASHRRPPPTALSQVASKPGLLITMTSTDDEGNDGDESNSPTNSSSQAVGFTEDDLHQGPADHDTEKAVGDEQQDLALDLPDIQPFEKREVGKWVALFPFEGECTAENW
nr:hypothetical protein BaRGS_004873 [Batillaria attramentaria]